MRVARALFAALALPLGGAALACSPFADGAPSGAEADARASDLWDWCPAPTPVSAVEEGALWLQFGEGALYCSLELPTWDTNVTAWSQLAGKAQLRLVPGDNFLPLEGGEHDVTLPVCARTASEDAPARSDGGRLVVERSEQLGRARLDLSYLETALDDDGEPLTTRLSLSGYEDDLAAGVLLDGAAWPLPDPDVRLTLCRGEACPGEGMALLDACRFAGPRELHSLRFDGGTLDFVLEKRDASTPARMRLVSATGAIDTYAFSQESFWSLVGRETWPWSSARDVAVSFSAPVAGFCGLEAKQLYADSASGTVELRRCDGGVTTRAVLAHTVVMEEPPPAPQP